MESIELGYFIEPPRARLKTIALKSKESIELGCSIVPTIALKSKESSEEHRA